MDSSSKDTFLENYPTPLQSLIPSSSYNLRVYWSQDDPQPTIQHKIICVFQNLQLDFICRVIIQFWAPTVSGGRQLLTTSNQPFALSKFDDNRQAEEYRLRCVNYTYNVDHVNNVEVDEDDPTNTIITNGPPASAFLNRIPELRLLINDTIHLMKEKKKNPLLSSALECGLAYSFVVPVFYPSQSDCVGVLECSIDSRYYLFEAFNKLNIALEEQGLKTFHVQHHLPYKTICGLQNAKDEIDEALKTILHAYGLPLSQVWIPNQVAFPSSLQDTPTKQIVWLKLTGNNWESSWHGDNFQFLKDYSDAHYRLPMNMDKMFAGKTLEKYEPCFIQDMSYDGDDYDERLVPFVEDSCSCFAICLRSTKTGDLDYVFEFFWDYYNNRNNVILLEQLFLTLKTYLSSFKFASGIDFGDEIDILDVNNSQGSENNYIKIFQGSKASLKRGRHTEVEECSTILKAKRSTKEKKLSQEQIESQFGQTLEEAAPKLNVSVSTLKRNCNRLGIQWHGKDRSKRNVKHSYKNQSNTIVEDQGGAIQDPSSAIIQETPLDENILTIKAEYTDDRIKFTLPISSITYEAIQKGIVKKFKLDCAAHYKLKYLDDKDNKWFLFNDDEDVTLCTKNKRTVYLMVMKM